MLGLAAGLPDALVRLPPDPFRAAGLRLDDPPQPPWQPLAAPGVQQDGVEHRAEHVVLALVERPVADPYRPGAGVAGQLVAGRLGEVTAPVDPVHDLQGAVVVGLEVGDELHELVGLPVEPQEVQRLQGEGRVPHPGVAVVPVALATRRLGQRRGQRRDRRAGRHVGQALDGQRRALDRLAPAVVGQPGSAQPGAPVAGGGVQPPVGLLDVLHRGQVLRPGQRAVHLVAFVQHVPGPDPVSLDAEREVGLQADRLLRPGGVGRVPAVADQRPLRRRTAVVERRLADQLDLDGSFQAADGAHQHVVGVVVGRRPGVRGDRVLPLPRAHGQRVPDQDPAGRRLPRGGHDVRAGLVRPRGRMAHPERPEPEVAGLPVEQRAEHAGRVEARDAQPADPPVRRDQRAGVAVGQERVVGDRRERRGRGRALRPLVSRGHCLLLSAVLRPGTAGRALEPTGAGRPAPHPARVVPERVHRLARFELVLAGPARPPGVRHGPASSRSRVAR